MEKRLGAAAIILNDQGDILLVKQSYGRFNWELPGGATEAGESIIETVLREVREETGHTVVAQRISGIYYEPANDFLHFAFICRDRTPDAEFDSDAEVTECAYWSTKALPRPVSDFTIRRIQDALLGTSLELPIVIGPRQWLE